MGKCKKDMCRPSCKPQCRRRCLGVYTDTYKMYENCCYSVVKVCPCCKHEFNFSRYSSCPHCGKQMDDPPRFGGRIGHFGNPGHFGHFGHFGNLGHFGNFGHFGGFFPFGYGFFPDFDEEEEEEFFY